MFSIDDLDLHARLAARPPRLDGARIHTFAYAGDFATFDAWVQDLIGQVSTWGPGTNRFPAIAAGTARLQLLPHLERETEPPELGQAVDAGLPLPPPPHHGARYQIQALMHHQEGERRVSTVVLAAIVTVRPGADGGLTGDLLHLDVVTPWVAAIAAAAGAVWVWGWVDGEKGEDVTDHAPRTERHNSGSPRPRVPKRKPDRDRWAAIWQRMRPMQHASIEEIYRWRNRMGHQPRVSHDTLADIRRAGQAGSLD